VSLKQKEFMVMDKNGDITGKPKDAFQSRLRSDNGKRESATNEGGRSPRAKKKTSIDTPKKRFQKVFKKAI